jgi:hypothetical protein
MLDDFPRNAWHVRGFPRKNISVGAEEVNELAFQFEGERSADAHHLVFRVAEVYEDLLDTLKDSVDRLESGASSMDPSLMTASSSKAIIVETCSQHSTSPLVSTLEGGADSDDLTRAWHLEFEVSIIGDSHELRVSRSSQDGVIGPVEPDHLQGEGLHHIVG